MMQRLKALIPVILIGVILCGCQTGAQGRHEPSDSRLSGTGAQDGNASSGSQFVNTGSHSWYDYSTPRSVRLEEELNVANPFHVGEVKIIYALHSWGPISPSDGVVEWVVGDPTVAEVIRNDPKGYFQTDNSQCFLIGLKPGTTTLTVVVETEEDRCTDTITITVVEREYTLLVKGEDVTYDYSFPLDPVFHAEEGYVELPLKRLWWALGGIVQGKDETVCMMYRQNEAFTFRYDDCTLIPEGGTQDVLAVPPGVTRHARREQNGDRAEMMIDHHSLQGLFDLFGVSIAVDYDNKIIDIH